MASRLSARSRLTLLYGAMVFVCGAGLIAGVYLLMRYIPRYVFQSVSGTGTPPDPSILSACPDLVGSAAPGVIAAGPSCPAEPAGGGMAGMTSASVTISSESDVLTTLLIMSAAALVVLTLVALAIGWWISGRLLAPVQRITVTARQVAAGNLSERINLPGGKSAELKQLADTFDDMLSRLDRSFSAQQRFAANASHELRTPITTTRTLLQVAMANPAEVDIGVLGAHLLETNRRSEHLINALLNLARADQGLDCVTRVDLAAITRAAVQVVLPEAASKGVQLEQDLQPALLDGDPELLRLLLVNLLQNGIRHNRPGGEVSVHTGQQDSSAVLTVCNSGPIIAPDQLEQLVEPFHRGAPRTYQQDQGHGLGLSIIRSITDAHGGQMRAVANPAGGLTVALVFGHGAGPLGGPPIPIRPAAATFASGRSAACL
ncbi:MAG: ATP-binding protein [Nakamurella sp.]